MRLIALALASVLGACASDAEATPLAPVAVDRQGAFVLEFTASKTVFAENEPIDAVAHFGYQGLDPVAPLSGSGSGPVFFDIEQLDGELDQTAAQRDDCRPHDLSRGQLLEVPYQKSGGFDGDGPQAAFWRAYFADPELRLPAGQYRLSAWVSLALGTACDGPRLEMRTSLMLTVE